MILLVRVLPSASGVNRTDEAYYDRADATFEHEVPAEGHCYLGTQCFQCANPPSHASVAIWIEKGMGLVIPGFVPSPLGEIVE